MAFELKDGQGTLFKNDKQGVETRPDYRGEINVHGEIMRVSGWLKDGAKGKWMSLSVERKEDKPAAKKPAAQPFDDSDSLPF
jgi:hypothetical protein